MGFGVSVEFKPQLLYFPNCMTVGEFLELCPH